MTAHNWSDDVLYGRYEVTLTVDVGSATDAIAAARVLAQFATEAAALQVLGYSLETTQIIGMENKRLKP